MKHRYTNPSNIKDMRRSRERSSLYTGSVDRTLDPTVQLKIQQHSKMRSSYRPTNQLRSRSCSPAFPELLVVRGSTGGKTVIQRSLAAPTQSKSSRICPSCSIPVGKPRLGSETIRCRGCNTPWHRGCASRSWNSFKKNTQCPDCTSYNSQAKRTSRFPSSLKPRLITETIISTWAPDSQESDVDITDNEELDVGGPMVQETSYSSPLSASIDVTPKKPSIIRINLSKASSRPHSGANFQTIQKTKPETALQEEEICPICDSDCTCQTTEVADEIDVCELVSPTHPSNSHSNPRFSSSIHSFSPSPQYISSIPRVSPYGSPSQSYQDEEDFFVDITDSPVISRPFKTAEHDVRIELPNLDDHRDITEEINSVVVSPTAMGSDREVYDEMEDLYLEVTDSPIISNSFKHHDISVEFSMFPSDLDDLEGCADLSHHVFPEPSYDTMVEETEDELEFNDESDNESVSLSLASEAESLALFSEALHDLDFSEDAEEDLEERHHLREREELYLIQKVMSGTQDWDSQDELESSPVLCPSKPTLVGPSVSPSHLSAQAFVDPDHPWFSYNPTYLSELLDEPPMEPSEPFTDFIPALSQTVLPGPSYQSSALQSDMELVNETDISGNVTPIHSTTLDLNDLSLFSFNQPLTRFRSYTMPSILPTPSYYSPFTCIDDDKTQMNSASQMPLHDGWNENVTPNQFSESPSQFFCPDLPSAPTLALEDVIDVSQLTSSPVLAPAHPLEPYFADALARWDRVPVTSFRARSGSTRNPSSIIRSKGGFYPRFSSTQCSPHPQSPITTSPKSNAIIASFNQLRISSGTPSHFSTPYEPLSVMGSPHSSGSPVYHCPQPKRRSRSVRPMPRPNSIRVHRKDPIDPSIKSTRRQLSRNRLARLNAQRQHRWDRLLDISQPPIPSSSVTKPSDPVRRKDKAQTHITRRRARKAKMSELYGHSLDFEP